MATRILEDCTIEELTDRAWELYEHTRKMGSDDLYRLDVIYGYEKDPFSDPDYDPDDPWFNLVEIENYMAMRGDE